MDAVLVRLLESVARPIALAIAHSLWQGALVAAIVGGALALLRGRSAARYCVACVGLLVILSSSVATGIWFARHPELASSQEVVWRKAATADEKSEGLSAEAHPAASAQDRTADGVAPRARRPRLPSVDMSLAGPWVFSAWVAGVLLMAAAHIVGWKRASALARLGTSAIPQAWRDRLNRLSPRLGIAGAVRAFVSDRVSVPTVVGWLRPIILIPAASLTELSAADLELVLIHELAHIRRHDVLVNYAQAAAEALLFFHPAVWWISRRIRIEREHCCDDAVVRMSGDGVAYARALSEVEQMRERTPAYAMAADGGAFRARIRRLVGATADDVGPSRAGLVGVLVVAIVLGLLVPSLTAAPVGTASAQVPTSVQSDWDDVEGEWRAEGFGGSIKMHFERPDWGECSLKFDDDSFDETGGDGYRLERDAGTFILEGGRFPRKWRKAIFRPNAAFASELVELGYEIEKEESLLSLAIHDVTLDFARGIAGAGYDLSADQLVAFHIHDVTPAYVRAMADVGYDQLTADRIVEFAIHDIEPEYVERMAAVGYEELTPDRIIEFAIHDIEAEYVERMAAIGYEELTPERLIEFSIHDIDPEYVERIAALGYEELTPDRIIEFAIHGIDAEYVEQMAAVGYEKLTPGRIVEFSLHGVEPSFVRGLKELGYGDMDPGRVVEFRIHDVTPEFIRDLESRGIKDLSPSELIEHRIHGRRHGRHKSTTHNL